MNKQSDTPRTDANSVAVTSSNGEKMRVMVEADFARQLERELNEAKASFPPDREGNPDTPLTNDAVDDELPSYRATNLLRCCRKLERELNALKAATAEGEMWRELMSILPEHWKVGYCNRKMGIVDVDYKPGVLYAGYGGFRNTLQNAYEHVKAYIEAEEGGKP